MLSEQSNGIWCAPPEVQSTNSESADGNVEKLSTDWLVLCFAPRTVNSPNRSVFSDLFFRQP